jgi:hypothetical protein
MRLNTILNAVLAACLVAAGPIVKRAEHNDYSCRSETNPNPIVFLHGLGATYYEDINILEAYLKTQRFCTFSLTYGDHPGSHSLEVLNPSKSPPSRSPTLSSRFNKRLVPPKSILSVTPRVLSRLCTSRSSEVSRASFRETLRSHLLHMEPLFWTSIALPTSYQPSLAHSSIRSSTQSAAPPAPISYLTVILLQS